VQIRSGSVTLDNMRYLGWQGATTLLAFLGLCCGGKAVVDPYGSGGAATTTSTGGSVSSAGGGGSAHPGCSPPQCTYGSEDCTCSATCPEGEFEVQCEFGPTNAACVCIIDGATTFMGVLTKDAQPCDVFDGACASQFFP